MASPIVAPLVFRAADTLGRQIVSQVQDNIRTRRPTPYGPMNASGKAAQSVRYALTPTSDGLTLTVYAVGYILSLEFGRKPGKFPPLQAIKDWIKVRRIVPKPDSNGRIISQDSLAYLIGRKIQQQGTILHRQGKPSRILADVIDGPALAGVERQLFSAVVAQVTTILQAA